MRSEHLLLSAALIATLLAPALANADEPQPVPVSPLPAAAKRVRHKVVKADPSAPRVVEPGFEMLPDGGSRIFVALTGQVPVEEKRVKSKLVYVLKGVRVQRANNLNALVTVHFNTPVTRAKLVPSGKDVQLVVDLRASASPVMRTVAGKEGTSVVQIDFPKGDFMIGVKAAPPPQVVDPSDSSDSDNTTETTDTATPSR